MWRIIIKKELGGEEDDAIPRTQNDDGIGVDDSDQLMM